MDQKALLDLGEIHANINDAVTEITQAEYAFKNMPNKPVELEPTLIEALSGIQKTLNNLSNAIHNWRIKNDNDYKEITKEGGQPPF